MRLCSFAALASLSAAILLSSCSSEQQDPKPDPVAEAPAKPTVQTVDYYLANKADRQKAITDCDNNPGELAETPNCINAWEADRKALTQGINDALEQGK